jgi:hypothetical protein
MRTRGFTEIIEETIIDNSKEENDQESDNNDTSLYEELLSMGHKMERSGNWKN